MELCPIHGVTGNWPARKPTPVLGDGAQNPTEAISGEYNPITDRLGRARTAFWVDGSGLVAQRLPFVPEICVAESVHVVWRCRRKRKQGAEVSTQYGGLPRSEHQRQLVAEALTLSLNDSAVLLYLFRAIYYLDRLPRCNMPVLPRAEDPVQHSAYSAQRHMAGM